MLMKLFIGSILVLIFKINFSQWEDIPGVQNGAWGIGCGLTGLMSGR